MAGTKGKRLEDLERRATARAFRVVVTARLHEEAHQMLGEMKAALTPDAYTEVERYVDA